MRNLEQESIKLSRKRACSDYSSEDVDFQPTKKSTTSETSDESNKINVDIKDVNKSILKLSYN